MRASLMYQAGDVRVEDVADPRVRMGHEFIGIVEDVGSRVSTLQHGDLVVSPFAISDNVCDYCREGLQTSCFHPQANFWDGIPDEGGQAEAIRVLLRVLYAHALVAAPRLALGSLRWLGPLPAIPDSR